MPQLRAKFQLGTNLLYYWTEDLDPAETYFGPTREHIGRIRHNFDSHNFFIRPHAKVPTSNTGSAATHFASRGYTRSVKNTGNLAFLCFSITTISFLANKKSYGVDTNEAYIVESEIPIKLVDDLKVIPKQGADAAFIMLLS